jgi:hypothetical protein
MTKKIGLIDYFLDEWHANNYPAWLRESAAEQGLDWDVAYAWADTDKPGGLHTDDWCIAHHVQRAGSLAELVERSDALIVLSPDHPEHHLRLSELALQSGKPVYIDKTFAPDLATAAKLFEMAAAGGTPIFSTSALRYSEQLVALPAGINADSISHLSVTGPGAFENYAVHQMEMIVALLGTAVTRVKSLSAPNGGRQLLIEFEEGRQASFLQINNAPFQLLLQPKGEAEGYIVPECTGFFPELMKQMLLFFESGVPPVPREQTLAVMALLDAGRLALDRRDEWISVAR